MSAIPSPVEPTPAQKAADPSKISPKVTKPAYLVLLIAVLSAGLAGITPDMLGFLGPWAGPVYMAVGAVIQFLAGYKVKDPARTGDPATPAPGDVEELPVVG